MKILYIANARMPTEKGHGWQIAKMCESFAEYGCSIKLIVPLRFNPIKKNPFNYYGIKKIFKIVYIPCFDLVKFGKIGFFIQAISFAIAAFFYSLFKKIDIIYSRDEIYCFFISFFKKNVYYEMHDYPKKRFWLYKIMFKRAQGIISTNHFKKNLLIKDFKIKAEKIFVQPNGIDLSQFNIKLNKKQIREKLQLPINKKIIGYVGKYKTKGQGKGAENLIDAFSKMLKLNTDIFLMFVGVNKDELEEAQKVLKHANVDRCSYKIITHVPHEKIAFFLKAPDVLVMNYPNIKDYAYFMCPLKMFEYMASGVPVVSTNLPSIREVLSEENAVIVEPDNEQSLIIGIKKVLFDERLAHDIANQALIDVKKYSWNKRTGNIINFIKS